MTPLEKIFIHIWQDGEITVDMAGNWSGDLEYHLAPVWHDAKTDPPKEGSYYLTFQRGYPMSVDYFILHEGKSIFEEGEPDYWMPLPEPPRESTENDTYTGDDDHAHDERIPAEKEKCAWTESTDPDVSYWDSGCGQTFYFDEGTPEENGMKYCPFCGKEASYPEPPKESQR